MATYSWALPTSGDWTTAANWTPAEVPNSAAADVVIDAPTTTQGGYVVTLPVNNTQTIASLSINANNNTAGSNTPEYTAAAIELDGTLVYAPGTAGNMTGSLQTYIHTAQGSAAEIVNLGTIDGFVQVEGSLLLTGTNGVYVTGWLQSLSGTVTVDSKSIAELDGNVLFDGIFDSKGPGALINLGGPLQDLIVNIETITGPPLIPDGWTEVFLTDPGAAIQEWDGDKYVSLESTLKRIGSRGTLDVLENRNYTTTNALTVDAGGRINLHAGTVSTGGLTLNGGIVEGSAVIVGDVINNGTLQAADGVLDVLGTLSGTGTVNFGQAGTLELHSVSAGQTIVMDGNDTLRLDTPETFAGTIVAAAGDKIELQGLTATSAVLNGGTLIVSNGTTVVDRLVMGGTTGNQSFTVNGSIVTVGTGGSPPDPAHFAVFNTSSNVASTAEGEAYTGPVEGLDWQYINITPDNINITANVANVFLHSGSGMDALDVRGVNGTNVLDGGTGSNFLVGGTGKDTFFLDNRTPTETLWSTMVNFHSGDDATVWGLTKDDFQVQTADNQGADGYKGLTFTFTKPGQVDAKLTLAGFSSADLTSGKIALSYGKTADLPNLPGSNFLLIHGT